METELKDLNSNPPEPDGSEDPEPVHNEASTNDDRPLLKSDPTSHVSSAHLEDLEKKFAAFVRYDVYGIMGRGELPTREKVLLGLALATLAPIRVVLCFTLLFTHYLICRICTLFYPPNREEEQEDYAHMAGLRRTLIIQSGRIISRIILFVLGFYWISETYRFPNTGDKPATEGWNDFGYASNLICLGGSTPTWRMMHASRHINGGVEASNQCNN